MRDSEYGDEWYEYDSEHRLTAVLDGERRPRLLNTYSTGGHMVSQTLAIGDRLLYRPGYNGRRQLASLTLTLPNGYTIDWMLNESSLTPPRSGR